MEIKIYEEWVYEAKRKLPLNAPLQGFAIDYGIMLIGAFPTFPQFAERVIKYVGVEYEEVEFIPDAENLSQEIESWTEDEMRHGVDLKFWHGLKPKSKKPFLNPIAKRSNPYYIIEQLEAEFTNSKQIFSKYPDGNINDVTYISRSIDTNPDLIELYITTNKLEGWELDAILRNTKLDPKLIEYYTKTRKTM